MIFYVYEHWRPDTSQCFYVGKGSKGRSHQMDRRSALHRSVVDTLTLQGLKVDVRIVDRKLSEDDAFILERERILFWKSKGVRLVNRTDGGEGASGLKWSIESRQKRSDINRRWMSDLKERKRISDALKGRKLEGEALDNFLAAMKARRGIKRGPLSAETRAKISKKATGRVMSAETKEKMARSHLGSKRSDETRRRQSESAKIAQRKRFEKLQSTKKGRESVKANALRMSRIAANNPEVRRKRSENAKALWSDPVYRAKVLAARCVPKPVVKGLS